MLDRIDALTARLRRHHDPAAERALARTRAEAFDELALPAHDGSWPPIAAPRRFRFQQGLPVATREELGADLLAAAIRQHGSLYVPSVLGSSDVRSLVEEIDRAFDERDAYGPLRRPRTEEERGCGFDPLQTDPSVAAGLGRQWVADGGGLLLVDAPHALHLLLELYERVGLRRVVTDYLGERPVLSANKCTLRRVPVTAVGGWHQDGAFLGRGIRAVNVWLALTDCGVEAPGLDLVPRRFDAVIETGTGGSLFDWAVGPATVAEVSGDTHPIRPSFHAGDVLIFDDLFLHQTAVDPAMHLDRHAVETWFFGRSAYPAGQLPVVW